MRKEPLIIDYEAPPAARPRTWGMSWPVWLLLAGFCAFAELAGWIAANGRVSGWGDILFIAVGAVIGLIALINAFHTFLKD